MAMVTLCEWQFAEFQHLNFIWTSQLQLRRLIGNADGLGQEHTLRKHAHVIYSVP